MEVAGYALLVYLPYLVAESLEMSGIVATLFAGIFVRHYAHPNLTPESQAQVNFLFRMLAYITESAVFLYLGALSVRIAVVCCSAVMCPHAAAHARCFPGLSVFRLDYSKYFHFSLVFVAIILCLAGRAVHIYPLSYLLNRARREVDMRIERKQQHMMWFSGLRGAVAFACATVFPNDKGNRDVFLITTMIIVLLTVFVMGTATVPVLKYLDIRVGVNEQSFKAPPPSDCTKSVLEFDRRHIMPYLTNWPGHLVQPVPQQDPCKRRKRVCRC